MKGRGQEKARTRRRPLLVAGGLIACMAVLSALLLSQGMLSPPMVIESRSMQHNDNTSALGVLDTGDMVVIDHSTAGIRSYLASVPTGHRSFGELGDVIVYQTPQAAVPIIHRVLCTVVYNATGGGFDIPELKDLPAEQWDVPEGGHQWWDLNDTVDLRDIGYADVDVHIDLGQILRDMGNEPHGGYLTMGDNNWYGIGAARFGSVDQTSLADVDAPIKDEWILGKAVAEIPWIGLLKLTVSNDLPHYTPVNSVAALVGVIALMSVVAAVAGVRYKIHRPEDLGKRKRP